MIRLLLAFCCLVALGLPRPAAAQSAGPPAADASAISPDQARAALDVLNDPAKRAAFAATLNAIVGAKPAAPEPGPAPGPAPSRATTNTGAAPTPAPAPASKPPEAEPPTQGLKIPLAPDSLGAQILVSASDVVGRLGTEAKTTLDTVQSLPSLYGWAVAMVTYPAARDQLIDVTWRLAIALVCAVAVQHALSRAIRRPIRSLEATASRQLQVEPEQSPPPPDDPENSVDSAEAEDTEPGGVRRPPPTTWNLLRRVPLVLARLVLELVPVLGIAAVGHLSVVLGVGGGMTGRLVILAVIDSYAVCAAVLCFARMLLSPGEHRLRLFHLRDTTASYLMRWIRRLAFIAVFGYAIGEIGLLLGLSDVAHDLLEKAVGLVLCFNLAIIIVQKRRPVRRVIRGPDGQPRVTAALRNRLGAIWHWIALSVLIALWLVWAVEVPHGYALMLHYFIVTALVLTGARLVMLLLLGLIDRAMRPAPDKITISPAVDARLRIYHPVVTVVLRLTMYILCVLGLLQLYGLNTFLWLVSSTLGLRILSGVGTIAATVGLAFAVWEVVNGYVHGHLDRLQREAEMARSARLRTLLPLLRSALLISIAVVAILMVLNEIGINIAPLLAGAGIVGVAIGFGSQKLVQDLITGIFLLLENAMQVGDSVTVSGLSGTVEALTVRTIRMRAADGSVHLIPFSSVTSVTNVNRGLGNASVSVVVSYEEDTDRVFAELKAVANEMRGEPAFSAMMLSDLELWGVDKVDGAGVTITGQVVCTDQGRWPVQREFNRRMKRRFQDLGIRIFNPVQTVSVTAEFPAPPPIAPSAPAGSGGAGGRGSAGGEGPGEEGKVDVHAHAAN
jgi:moderate conductance mechanosensitive channel